VPLTLHGGEHILECNRLDLLFFRPLAQLAKITVLIDDPQAWGGLRGRLIGMAHQAPLPVKYVPNQGNAGDALIASGTWQFFEDCRLTPRYAGVAGIGKGDWVIYAGGGNLVPEYNNCQRFLERCLQVGVARALVLPHSVRGHEALLARLDRRFSLVCREAASLMRVQGAGTGAELLYAPDMALYIDVERLFARARSLQGVALWTRFARHGKLWSYRRWRVGLERRRPLEHGEVEIIRGDAEATEWRGDPECDLPNLYGSFYRFREEGDLISRDLLAYFNQVRRVRTNRLHMGVAGALMHCDVRYLDNSYGKIRAVYDAWLSHLPSVRFETSVPPGTEERA